MYRNRCRLSHFLLNNKTNISMGPEKAIYLKFQNMVIPQSQKRTFSLNSLHRLKLALNVSDASRNKFRLLVHVFQIKFLKSAKSKIQFKTIRVVLAGVWTSTWTHSNCLRKSLQRNRPNKKDWPSSRVFNHRHAFPC